MGATTDVRRASARASFYKWKAKYGGDGGLGGAAAESAGDENAKLTKEAVGRGDARQPHVARKWRFRRPSAAW